jgi:hypothetical protein
MDYLEGTTVADVAASRQQKLRMLEKSRKPRRVAKRQAG